MRVVQGMIRRAVIGGVVLTLGAGAFDVGSSPVTAAVSTPFEWNISGPREVRFSGAATSLGGEISFAVPDPACGAGVAAKGYRSVNGGVSWNEMSNMPSRFWMSVDSSADGQKVVATGFECVAGSPSRSEVFRSTDAGITWSVSLAFDPLAPGTVYGDVSSSDDGSRIVVGTNVGVFYSPDAGQTWTSIHGVDTSGVAVSGSGAIIMIAERNGPLLVSNDSGATWTVTDSTARNWTSIELSTDGQSAFAVATRFGSNGGAFYTHDGGSTWSDSGLTSTFVDSQLAIGAMSPNGDTMIASSYYSDPYVSTDGGVSWSVIPSSLSSMIGSGWTGFAVANPVVGSPLNAVESRIIAVTENSSIARFDFPEQLPVLPATGASQSVVHAVLIMVMGLSVLVVSRRRFRVR